MTIEEKLQGIADYYGLQSQMNQVIEECSELIQAIAKYNRTIGNGYETPVTTQEARLNIIEELADVQFVAFQLVYLLECEDTVLSITDKKADRQMRRIDKQTLGNSTLLAELRADCIEEKEE